MATTILHPKHLAREEPAARQRPNSSFGVLIVDDNDAARRLLADRLGAAWPFERDLAVDYAADAVEALAKVQQTRYALLVLHWNLPWLEGGRMLRLVRQGGRRIPVVAISRLEREDIGEDLESLGVAFLHKDELKPDSLREAIAASLRLLGFAAPQRQEGF